MDTLITTNNNNNNNNNNTHENNEISEIAPLETQTPGKYSVILEGDHLSVVGQNLDSIPLSLGEEHGIQIRQLDLSYNNISQLENLQSFTKLHSLVLDNNILKSDQTVSQMPSLQTLCVNNNKIDDLKVFMDTISKSFPSLTYLSMLKNPACPNYFNGKDSEDYQRYRYYVLFRIKKLKFLDSTEVTEQERKESNRVGPYMIVSKPDASQYNKKIAETEETSSEFFLPEDSQPEGAGSARFGISTYVYYGKHSEGNRFILNEDL